METKKTALNVAGVVFFFVALLHLVRVIFHLEIVIENFRVPLWYSGVGFCVAFLLSIWMFKSTR